MRVQRFALWSGAILAVLLGGVWLLTTFDQTPDRSLSTAPWRYYALAVFPALITLPAYSLALRSITTAPNAFVRTYYASMGLKFMASLLFILAMALFTEPNLLALAGVFFVSYFTYTGLEVSSLLSNLRRQKEPASTAD
jgi:hypothetical protein